MKNTVINLTAAIFVFIAIVTVAAAAGMMDQGASVIVCVKLIAGSVLALTAAAGITEWRRIF